MIYDIYYSGMIDTKGILTEELRNKLKGFIVFSRENEVESLEYLESTGVYVPYANQTITYNEVMDESIEFIFQPSNIRIRFDVTQCDEDANYGRLYIQGTFNSIDEFDCEELFPRIHHLKTFLKSVSSKKTGRELSSIAALGSTKGLPENIEGTIGSYLSGKPGTLTGQMNQLKQNTGIQLAPKARKSRTTRTLRKYNTRKNRR